MSGSNTHTCRPELQAKCGACNKPAFEDKQLSKCGRCKKVYYHDANCQKKHYPQHKKVCKQMAASFVGMKVVNSGTPLGRVAVSKEAFNSGDVVLAEVPAIVFDDQNYIRLFTEYLDASSDVQASIFDMHHNVDTIKGLQNQFLVSQLQIFQHEKKALLTLEIAEKLLSIVNHNAHEYNLLSGKVKVYAYGVPPKSEAALYTLGSKIEHSCVPNVTMKTTDLGLLQYQALIPIEEEVRIGFSYMSSVYNEPRMARREFLQTNKGFQCECKRCIGFDECNPFKCHNCQEESMFEAGSKSGIYCCILCDHEDRKSELIEKQIEKVNLFRAQLDALLSRLQSGDLDVAYDCLQLQSEIADHCASPLHWLYPQIWTLISSAFASLARMDMKEGIPPTHPDVAENLRMAGYAELQEVKWIQRIISIVHGWESLKDVVIASKEDAGVYTSTGDNGVATILDVQNLINDLTKDTTTMRYPNSNVTMEIFRAGQDLVLGGELTEDVSRLFGRYSNDLASMKGLGLTDEQLNSITVLVHSNGRINQFSNHLL